MKIDDCSSREQCWKWETMTPTSVEISYSRTNVHSRLTIRRTTRMSVCGLQKILVESTSLIRSTGECLNVWAGILDQNILGPIFINGSLTGEGYVSLLQNEISALIEDLAPPYPIWYLHDGCPAHNYGPAQDYLAESFPGQVIGTHTQPLSWPPRSPDMNKCDYFLWGHVKSTVYRNAPFPDLVSLRAAIEECFATITHGQLANVTRDFEERLGHCIAAGDGLFEHLL